MDNSASTDDPGTGPAAGTKRPPESNNDKGVVAKKPATATTSTTTQQLQQQIQQQLQQQLQAQLQAAAARGQQANITPEQIQAQAQAMVQAAAQAQAVVAAAKSRGDGLVPMTAQQIAALSQIQAQAIVHARKSVGTPQQIQTQIQLQAQALVHAHTQAQIQAGIYKGDTSKEGTSGEVASKPKAAPTTGTSTVAAATAAPAKAPPPAETSASTTVAPPATTTIASAPTKTTMTVAAAPVAAVPVTTTVTLTPAQMQQHEELKRQHEQEKLTISNGDELEALQAQQQQQLTEQLNRFRQQNMSTFITEGTMVDTSPTPSSNSPQFLAQLHGRLNDFWRQSLSQIQQLENQTEQDFKNHNDLPLARIKRIMKSDEDVRMISAEAPVLFAKACELFILDLSIRAFEYSQLHKRRTLQKEDVKEAIQKTDIFDFLVDVIQ